VKIVHVITALPADGAEMQLYRLVRVSRGEGVKHAVISMSSDDTLAARLREAGAEVRIIGMRRGVPAPTGFVKLVRWLDELQPDVVQSWLYHGDLLGGLALHAANAMRKMRGSRLHRPPLVWGIHHTDLRSIGSNRTTRWVTKACALLSRQVPDLIVCCGEAARRAHIEGGYSPEKITVIPNGFELDIFRPMHEARGVLRAKNGLLDDALIVGIVGRYHPVKDHSNFIAAMRIVIQTVPQCRFIMAGRGLDDDNRELVKLVRDAELEHACRLLGPLKQPATMVAGLDVFCLSSRSEGMPTVIGEAMACGVPCVGTDVGDTALLIGDTGTVVPPENPQALAGALIDMLTLPDEMRAKKGAAARDRIERLFSIEASWRGYKEVYAQTNATLRKPRRSS
jgi:glycosyltransferase involved in cell wall biosynthesis